MEETWVLSLDQEDPLEEGMATHSSILAWKILWTEAWQDAVHRVEKGQTSLSMPESCCRNGYQNTLKYIYT